jgi:hypothetical protein
MAVAHGAHGFPGHRVRLAERARSPNGCRGVAAHEAFKIAAGNMLGHFGLHDTPVGKKVPR